MFWDNLLSGLESITFFTEADLLDAGIPQDLVRNPDYVRAKGMLADADRFDADFFGYPPSEAEKMDPQLRLLHETSWAALEAAGYDPVAFDGTVGAYFGANDNSPWLSQLTSSRAGLAEDYDHFLLSYRDYVATRIAHRLDLKGPAITLLSACSTSLVAIHLACRALRAGECDMALAGGVSLTWPEKSGYLHQDGFMLSSDGHCRTFDAKADGTVFGDGVGVVVLRRLGDAVEAGDHVHAVVIGTAVNNDGRDKLGFTAPSVAGQARAVRAALGDAGVAAETIDYVETHGTATTVGDPIEVQALTEAFGIEARGQCGIGSVKTNIGHLNIAAGVAAFMKTVLAIEHRVLPRNLHLETPHPALNLDRSPFFVVRTPTRWIRRNHPRRAGVSAFGFGGTNAHAVIEEAPRRRPVVSGRPTQVLMVSARTEPAARLAADRLAAHLSAHPEISLAAAAYTTAAGRRHFACRRAVVVRTTADAAERLARPARWSTVSGRAPSVAFLFPGQGAQCVGMGRSLYRSEPAFRAHVDRGAALLKDITGRDIRDLLDLEGVRPAQAEDALTDTQVAQPAIFLMSHALAMLLIEWGIEPAAVVGHSLGELAAATVAGVFTLADALSLVAHRGRMMQELSPGAMLAVTLGEEALQPRLNAHLALAAVNGPELCVVSGGREAIAALETELRRSRVATQLLVTSHAFHSPLVDGVLEPFARLVDGVARRPPRVPMLSTVTGEWVSDEEITRAQYWARNLRQPVRFSSAVRRLLAETDHVILEVGPGRTLSSLTRMHLDPTDPRPVLSTLSQGKEPDHEHAALMATIGRLWECGVGVNLARFFEHEPRRRTPLPTYPFEGPRFRTARPGPTRAPGPTWSALVKKPDLADWFYVPSWRRSVLPPPPMQSPIEPLNWLILADAHGLAERLTTRLDENGQHVTLVRPGAGFARVGDREYTVAPGDREDYDRLFRELDSRLRLPRRIIHLWNLTDGGPPLDAHGIEAVQDESLFSLLFLAQVIGSHNVTDEVRIVVVTCDLHEVIGGEPVRPEKAPVLGPVKVIPQEYPHVSCCCIDVRPDEHDERLADRLLHESISNVTDPVVAYRGAHRWAQAYERCRLEAQPAGAGLRERGVYLITGGLGGLGLVLAEYLARTVHARLVLTGRSALPPESEWDGWLETHGPDDPVARRIRGCRRVQAAGGEVMALSADVEDLAQMVEVVESSRRRFGTIHGVVHAAGLPGEGIIQLKKREAARRIIAPKVRGMLVVEELFRDAPLDFVVLCSSIAAVLGGIGLADYSAANAFLDATASRADLHARWPVYSINWDMWGEVGMGLTTRMPDELQVWLEKELRDGITSAEGVEVFQRVLGWGRPGHLVVSTRNLQDRIDLWLRKEFVREKESLMESDSAAPQQQRPNLDSSFVPPQSDVERKVATAWERLFGIAPVGRDDSFYELGGHSLLATTLVNKLKREFATSLSIRDIMAHPTVGELAAFIEQRMA